MGCHSILLYFVAQVSSVWVIFLSLEAVIIFLLELYFFFSALWDCKMLQVHLVYFLSLFENQFVQSTSSFHQRTTQGAKIKGWGMVSASEGLSF